MLSNKFHIAWYSVHQRKVGFLKCILKGDLLLVIHVKFFFHNWCKNKTFPLHGLVHVVQAFHHKWCRSKAFVQCGLIYAAQTFCHRYCRNMAFLHYGLIHAAHTFFTVSAGGLWIDSCSPNNFFVTIFAGEWLFSSMGRFMLSKLFVSFVAGVCSFSRLNSLMLIPKKAPRHCRRIWKSKAKPTRAIAIGKLEERQPKLLLYTATLLSAVHSGFTVAEIKSCYDMAFSYIAILAKHSHCA